MSENIRIRRISFRVTQRDLELMKRLVNLGYFSSISHLVRIAILMLTEKEFNKLKMSD